MIRQGTYNSKKAVWYKCTVLLVMQCSVSVLVLINNKVNKKSVFEEQG